MKISFFKFCLIAVLSQTITLLSCGDDEAENGAPVISNQSFMVLESAGLGTVIGIIQASDPEGNKLDFSVVPTSSLFGINSSSEELTLLDVLDYETETEYVITIEVSDGIEISSAVITINVTDVDDNLVPIISDQDFSINENPENGTVIGTVLASDSEDDQISFLIIEGNTSDVFAIDVNTGVLSVVGELDFEVIESYSLTIQASDENDASSANVSIAVLDLDDSFQEIADLLANNVWNLTFNGAKLNSVIQSDWNELAIEFTGNFDVGTYSTSSVPVGAEGLWPSSDVWEFNGNHNELVRASDDNVLTIVSIDANGLILNIDYEAAAGRITGIDGDWTFTFEAE